jgi:hypothetical protein
MPLHDMPAEPAVCTHRPFGLTVAPTSELQARSLKSRDKSAVKLRGSLVRTVRHTPLTAILFPASAPLKFTRTRIYFETLPHRLALDLTNFFNDSVNIKEGSLEAVARSLGPAPQLGIEYCRRGL